ncbi:hypothetical protein LOAG_10034 [Loa loa]|uniref:Uncharacterized protein n=1 Tax=Loa loa TaxID=7209 RepID=A0A1S0TQQ0_LOALO|nr:hypothetical protein LOAG_10034 [Loa loa]EFO18464.1 hypothetical protein LOAG_10034 [Loa loa]
MSTVRIIKHGSDVFQYASVNLCTALRTGVRLCLFVFVQQHLLIRPSPMEQAVLSLGKVAWSFMMLPSDRYL